MTEKDIVIVGGGPGGYVAAIHAAHLGASVALVEKDELGGTCLNRGCIPTKLLAKTVEILRETRKAAEFGIEVGDIRVDFPKVMEHKNQVVDKVVSGIRQLMKMNRVSVYRGKGRILTQNLVEVNEDRIFAKKIIVATGSTPANPLIPGMDLPRVYNTDRILQLTERPGSLIIIGGGYVGAEFAGIFHGLGTRITILEMLPSCLYSSDDEIQKLFFRRLRQSGIDVKTGVVVKAIREEDGEMEVVWDTPKGECSAKAKAVLVAAGRTPYTDGLGLAEIGVEFKGHFVAVNDSLETSVPGIYAVGDVTGKIMLAHVASYQGEVAVENALENSRRTVDYRVVPSCIFTLPEMASVGLTEREAKEAGLRYKISKFPFSASTRAATMTDDTGTVKMICREVDGKLLGMHIIGPHASDLIAEGALAMHKGCTAADLVDTIHAHPTLSEAVQEAARGHFHGPIHYQKL